MLGPRTFSGGHLGKRASNVGGGFVSSGAAGLWCLTEKKDVNNLWGIAPGIEIQLPYLQSQQELNAWNKYNNTNFNWSKSFSTLNLTLLEYSPAMKDREIEAPRMIWEEDCKASQVFTELWSFLAKNNSMDQCFLKYGLEICIRITRLLLPTRLPHTQDFLVHSKQSNKSGRRGGGPRKLQF